MNRLAFILTFSLFSLLGICNNPVTGGPQGDESTQQDSTAVQPKDTIQTAVPVAAPSLQGTVEVSFRIDGKGEVEIVNIKADNSELIEYVISRLRRIKLDPATYSSGKTIHYKFEFKKQA